MIPLLLFGYIYGIGFEKGIKLLLISVHISPGINLVYDVTYIEKKGTSLDLFLGPRFAVEKLPRRKCLKDSPCPG